MDPIKSPREVMPTRVRRSPEGRLALYFAEGAYSDPSPHWVLFAIRGDLCVELLTEEDVATWREVPLDTGDGE